MTEAALPRDPSGDGASASVEERVWLPYVEAGTGSDVFTRDLARWLEAEGVKVILQRFPGFYEAVPFLLRRAAPPPDATTVIANSWNAFAFARTGLKMIVVEHLFVLDPRYRPYKSVLQMILHAGLVRRFLAASYRAADIIVAPCQDTATALRRVFPERVPKVVRHGVDIDFFHPPAVRPPLRGRRPRLAFLSARTPRKGIDMLGEVLELLGSDIELSIAGEPDATFKRDDSRLRFVGRLDRAGVREVLQRCDILLVTSRLESGPLVALEAMACGVPVVAFDTASLPEVVDDGVTGRVIAVDDAQAFAAAIDELASDPEALERMRAKCRRVAVERFSHRKMAQQYRGLMDQVLRSGDPHLAGAAHPGVQVGR